MHGTELGPVTRRLASAGLKEALATREVQKAKMTAMNGLISGLAHEINTPLGALCASADTLRRAAERISDPELEDGADKSKAARGIVDSARIVIEASRRLEMTMRALQDFARIDQAEECTIDPRTCIENALRFTRYRLGERIRVEQRFEDIPELRCRPAELNMVFVHLLHNAIDAIDGEGTITIETRRVDEVIEISIKDTGRGIPPEDRARLFQPSLTKKAGRVRAGFGLAICARVVTAHNGAIDVASQPGRGSTFTILLPVTGTQERKY